MTNPTNELLDACLNLDMDEVQKILNLYRFISKVGGDPSTKLYFENKEGRNALIETVLGIKYTDLDRSSAIYRATCIMEMLTDYICFIREPS